MNMSWSERKAQMPRTATPHLVEGDSHLRPIDRAPPGDVVMKARRAESHELVKQRSTFFEDAFSVKESNPARESVRREAIVLAEVKTNVIVRKLCRWMVFEPH
jgi:hypothetical protein